MGLLRRLVEDAGVKQQLCGLLVVTSFVVGFELMLYKVGVVPFAKESTRGPTKGRIPAPFADCCTGSWA